MSPAMIAAWRAYYEALRDHPEATPDERQRAADMLRKGDLMGIKEFEPEDLA